MDREPRETHNEVAEGPVVGRLEVLRARPDLAEVWDRADRLFPVRVTRSFWRRIQAGDPDDPLAKQVLPDDRELVEAPGDLLDPVGDSLRSPVPWVVHKYPQRVLVLVTKRCHLYCRYCFRRTHQPGESLDPTDAEWTAALEYAANSGAKELILSGGDPLAVRDDRLFDTLDRLRHIENRRIHTRAPITMPSRVTDALCEGLRERAPVWVIVHCNHPRELSDDVDVALARLVDHGIPVLNQSVLLKGVNDDVDTQVALCEALVKRRVFPYYLHHTDQVAGNAHLRVEVEEGLKIWRGMRARLSGLSCPRYVIDPADGRGKRDVERYLEHPDE